MINIPNVNYLFKITNERGLILIDAYFNKERFRYSTQVSLPVSEWSKKTNRPVKNHPKYHEICTEIENVKNTFVAVYEAGEGKLSSKEIKAQLDIRLGRVKFEEIDLIQTLQKIREETTDLKASTKKSYKSQVDFIKGFFDYKGRKYTIADLNEDFITDFKKYVLIERNLSSIYARRLIKTLKSLLNKDATIKKGVHAFKERDFSIKDALSNRTPRRQSIYLSTEEVNRLLELKVTGEEEKYRDLFVFCCNVGARVSNLLTLTKDNFRIEQGYNILTYLADKNEGQCILVLNPIALSIAKKYNFELPNTFKGVSKIESEGNEVIKALCSRAGINEMHEYFIQEHGEKKKVSVKKYESVSWKVARNTFITNTRLTGALEEESEVMVGHTRRSMNSTYSKAEGIELAIRYYKRVYEGNK